MLKFLLARFAHKQNCELENYLFGQEALAPPPPPPDENVKKMYILKTGNVDIGQET